MARAFKSPSTRILLRLAFAEGLDLRQTFFVHDPGWNDKTWEVLRGKNSRLNTKGKDQLEKVSRLDGTGILQELVGEQLKLSFIRARKHSKIGLAFYWLAVALSLLLVWILALSAYFYRLFC